MITKINKIIYKYSVQAENDKCVNYIRGRWI